MENDSLISFPAFIIILDIKTPIDIGTSSKVDVEFMGEQKRGFGFYISITDRVLNLLYFPLCDRNSNFVHGCIGINCFALL